MAIDYGSDSVVQTISEEEDKIKAQSWWLVINVKVDSTGGQFHWDRRKLYYEVHVNDPNKSDKENMENYYKIDNANPMIYTDDEGLYIKGHVSEPNGLTTLQEFFYAKGAYKHFSKHYEEIT